MTRNELIESLSVPFRFRSIPAPMEADLRASWRIPVLLLLLSSCCRGRRTSYARLTVLNWASRNKNNFDALLQAVGNPAGCTHLVVRFEPSLNRAIEMASGFGLVTVQRGNRVQLTDRGDAMVRRIQDDNDLLVSEKALLSQLGGRLTETLASKLIGVSR